VQARNGHEPHQIVRYARNLWGVQFHPELNAEGMRELIASDAPKLASEGVDVEKALASIADSPCGHLVLQRLRELAEAMN
jgi:GMP synthase (glutamine-hydrolysing)